MGYLPYEFLLPEWNHRTDAYGGSVANRVRIVRELLEVTHEAVGGKCAVALRISLEELRGAPERVAPNPKPTRWSRCSPTCPTCGTSRWTPRPPTARRRASPPKAATSRSSTSSRRSPRKPVVGVGRFTSPDTMVGQIRRGVLDLIGAARPSIADPFLPHKIDEGREQDIRECIGCNICISSWHDSVPVRCTQNPTIGEEWRRGWHPERIAPGRQFSLGADRRRRPRGPRMRADARPARLRRHRRRSRRGDRRPPALRDPPAGAGRLGARARLAPRPAGAAAEREHLSRQPAVGATTSSSSATRTW